MHVSLDTGARDVIWIVVEVVRDKVLIIPVINKLVDVTLVNLVGLAHNVKCYAQKVVMARVSKMMGRVSLHEKGENYLRPIS